MESARSRRKLLPAWVGSLAAFFPVAWVMLDLLLLYMFILRPSPGAFLALLVLPYLVPVALFRLVSLVSPIREGVAHVTVTSSHPWVIAYHLQQPFNAFAAFERLLLILPGVYSFWLRLW